MKQSMITQVLYKSSHAFFVCIGHYMILHVNTNVQSLLHILLFAVPNTAYLPL